MEYQELELGEVTYEVQRFYSGDCSAAELLLNRLTQKAQEKPSFDEIRTNTL